MKIKDVTRYTIPLGGSMEGTRDDPKGTTVEELIAALQRLPKKAIVTNGGGWGELHATHVKPDIDSECPWVYDSVWRHLLDQNRADIQAMARLYTVPEVYQGVHVPPANP